MGILVGSLVGLAARNGIGGVNVGKRVGVLSVGNGVGYWLGFGIGTSVLE